MIFFKTIGLYIVGPEIKEDFFCGSEVTVVTANVYYEDTNAERMVPSEISILKFSVARGIYDQRHFILGFGKHDLPNEVCMKEAVENGVFYFSGFAFSYLILIFFVVWLICSVFHALFFTDYLNVFFV